MQSNDKVKQSDERVCTKCLNIHSEEVPCPDPKKVREMLRQMGVGVGKGDRRQRRELGRMSPSKSARTEAASRRVNYNAKAASANLSNLATHLPKSWRSCVIRDWVRLSANVGRDMGCPTAQIGLRS